MLRCVFVALKKYITIFEDKGITGIRGEIASISENDMVAIFNCLSEEV